MSVPGPVPVTKVPPLFVPRRDQFVHVDALPLLGTGKLDLAAVRARCLAAARPEVVS